MSGSPQVMSPRSAALSKSDSLKNTVISAVDTPILCAACSLCCQTGCVLTLYANGRVSQVSNLSTAYNLVVINVVHVIVENQYCGGDQCKGEVRACTIIPLVVATASTANRA